MKNIEAISIWDKGQLKQATIYKAYATNLELNKSANFWYGLYTESKELVASGNLALDGDDYQLWDEDGFAWDFIAKKLNLVVTGDYVEPVVEVVEPISEPITEPIVEEPPVES